MEGIIVNYRGSHKTQYPNQMIVKINDINTKEKAKELIKKTVIWETPTKKQIKGTITKEHGNKGAVRVKFEKGLPGQAIGTKVKIE
jgi:large subunit ribosomal protein L35Ae